MQQRCDLCGARLFEGDERCRTCGEPVPPKSEPTVGTAAPTVGTAEPTAVAAEPTPMPEPEPAAAASSAAEKSFAGMSGPVDTTPVPPPPNAAGGEVGVAPPSRMGMYVALALLLLVGGGVVAFFVWPEGEPAPEPVATEQTEEVVEVVAPPPVPDVGATPRNCPDLEALAGKWEFTTEVVTSVEEVKLGLRGFYEMNVKVDAASCEAKANLVKTGYTGKAYPEKRILKAEAKLVPGQGALAFGYEGTFQLRSEVGGGPQLQFVFAPHEGEITGAYRYRGRRWDASGLAGVLEGGHDAKGRIFPKLKNQPCMVQCAVACNWARRDAEPGIPAAIEACASTCESGGADALRCGDPPMLPESLVLPLEGPKRGLKRICATLTAGAKRGKCFKSPLILKKRSSPALTQPKLEGAWRDAELVRAIGRGKDRLYLVVHTTGGWFYSAPILDLKKASFSDAKLYARSLTAPGGRRHIVGYVAKGAGKRYRENAFACHLDLENPKCAVVPARVGEDGIRTALTPLPGGALQVGPSAIEGVQTGVYRW